MKRAEFKTWLGLRNLTASAIATRISAVARVERVMAELGDPAADLDAAHDRDGLAGLKAAIAALATDAAAGGTAYLLLFPGSTSPAKRLQSHRAYLGQYAAFRQAHAQVGRASGWPELEQMRLEFLRRAPDFIDFTQTDGTYFDGERGYKDAISARIAQITASEADDREAGRQIARALIPGHGPILQWQYLDRLERVGEPHRSTFHRALGESSRSRNPAEQVLADLIATLESLRDQATINLPKGAILNIALSVVAFARPEAIAPFKIDKARKLAARLAQPAIGAGPITRVELDSWQQLLRRILGVMRDDWGWRPRDLFDVQGFAWMVLDDGWIPAEEEDEMETTPAAASMAPLNTILYGPPGTGKTFHSRLHAVAICDGRPEADRLAQTGGLQARYEALRAAGRIGFVTFHQSFSYEDFIEGLRPDPTESGAGFGLAARPGILRQMADLAARGRSGSAVTASSDLLAGREVFKMSLGAIDSRDDAHVFDECIRDGHALLGWGGEIDWSDARYDERDAITRHLAQHDPAIEKPAAQAKYLHAFRNRARIGDIVVVSRGNLEFRAIGIFESAYEFHPREDDRFHHRRRVRWLWHDGALPSSQILSGRFSQETIYRISPASVNFAALAAYLTPPGATGHLPYVLIIDEINRANVSKVFGEMITLLEPDKRAGGAQAISVTLPYSGDRFSLPANLHVLGTMNTADRSIALLDTALRRRFAFIEMAPDPDLLSVCEGIDLAVLLSRLNERIEYLFDRDHLIGHACFMGCTTRADLDAVMRHKVIPLLAEYFHEDWDRVIAILGGPAQGFLTREPLAPPPGLDPGEGEIRWRHALRETFAPDAYAGLQA